MFNSYVDNKFNYNVNAVSGTLRKTMKDSKFIISKLNDDLYIFNPNRQSLYYKSDPIVILQIMLIGDNKCLIEFVEKDIFDKIMSDSENGSVEQEEKITEEELEKKAKLYADEHFADRDENGEWLSNEEMLSRAYIAGAKESHKQLSLFEEEN